MNPLRGAGPPAVIGMIISLAPAVIGALFAIRPSERLLSYMRPLSLAAIFAALCTICTGVANGAVAMSRQPQFNSQMLAGGIAELFAGGAVSFVFLTVGWLCVAIGMRRHGAM